MEKTLFSLSEMGGIELWEVIDAYYECRRRKRRTVNAMKFELNWEAEAVSLWGDINNGTYRPGRSIAFIVTKPTKREIFAADFRDRVVHHLIARKILPLLEARFIDDSYSTREGKGTLYGINRIAAQLREVSCNYTVDCYIMRLDIEGFFMSIVKEMLYKEIKELVNEEYAGTDRTLLLWLIYLTVMNRPEENCIRKSPQSAWEGLPARKSLFGGDGTCGLPIGNLTSQLLALLHLDPLDHLIREEWGIEGHGRYVDDMVLIDRSKARLLAVREKIDRWLREHGHRLHPRKVYLQHFRKGVLFVGGMIRPGYILMGHRSIGFAQEYIRQQNRLAEKAGGEVTQEQVDHFVASMNSYLGMTQQFKAFGISQDLMRRVSPQWYRYAYFLRRGRQCKIIRNTRAIFIHTCYASTWEP